MWFYTPAEEQWLKENAKNYINSIAMAEDFNKKFGTERTAEAIRCKARSYGHKFGWSGGKEKGQGMSTTALPVGTEKWKGGYWYIKINTRPLPKNFTCKEIRENWVQKHRYIWEQANRKIKDDEVVIFLDGDRNNFDLKNLYCTSKNVTPMMIRNGWFSDNSEQTLTALKLCELSYFIKGE